MLENIWNNLSSKNLGVATWLCLPASEDATTDSRTKFFLPYHTARSLNNGKGQEEKSSNVSYKPFSHYKGNTP
jgi:hypothetical protein